VRGQLEWAFEGLELQDMALIMMSSNWNVEDVTAKYDVGVKY
jgi:hypothetical protein